MIIDKPAIKEWLTWIFRGGVSYAAWFIATTTADINAGVQEIKMANKMHEYWRVSTNAQISMIEMDIRQNSERDNTRHITLLQHLADVKPAQP